MCNNSILLPTAIVNLVNATDVSYGEVFILSIVNYSPSGGTQACSNVTLGFTHFEGTNIHTYDTYVWVHIHNYYVTRFGKTDPFDTSEMRYCSIS